jgi:hypothetical protein
VTSRNDDLLRIDVRTGIPFRPKQVLVGCLGHGAVDVPTGITARCVAVVNLPPLNTQCSAAEGRARSRLSTAQPDLTSCDRNAPTEKNGKLMSSVSPSNALSPRVMLATGVHAQPGVYALLLGSGVSRSAGISTGWEIVQHLVRKAAAASAPDDAESLALAKSDPEAWWAEHGEGDLGYSSLLAAIAPSSAARQGLLAEYFVATDKDRDSGLKLPTVGHRAIAELVKAEWIKVIVTTNFDKLMEQALDAVGVAHQVIARPDAASAVTPLAHATATIIKLHGDWTDLEFRNTIDELDEYPQSWIDFLRQVFNEYGLLISGWSAEWDKALVRVLEATPRRYPLYWDSRSSKSGVARNLLAQHGGHVIQAESADELFTSLAASVEALARLAEPPLTTAMAVARLKRALPNPLRRIELRDLILDHTRDLADALFAAQPNSARDISVVNVYLDTMFEAIRPTLTLLVNGVRYDDGTYTGLWVEAIQAILDRRTSIAGQMVQTYDELRNYPALLALRAMSIEAVRQGKDDVLIALLTMPHWDDPFHAGRSAVAADVLHLLNVLDGDVVNALPRWGNNVSGWVFPPSHLLKVVLEDFFVDNGLDAAQYRDLCDEVEYRTGLVQFLLPQDRPGYHRNPIAGEFILDDRWDYIGNSLDNAAPDAEIRFREFTSRRGHAAWDDLLGDLPLEDVLVSYRSILQKYMRR